jgi:two-component system chemotaxis sensor kinase CheA
VTVRTQLREILESAGYRVTTAADGMEAFANLQAGEYDLLVTDVEMPRLDGFGLTARVRRDERLSQLPVILVTALDSREDKERGVEVGANAYIVKRGFSQQRLLDTIRTLL